MRGPVAAWDPQRRARFGGRQGGTIAPTGKVFAVDMVTVGIRNRQGTMDEEFLFWDNQTFYREMGLG